MFLKNREVRIQLAKTPKNDTTPDEMEAPIMNPEQISAIAKDFVKETAKIVVVAVAAGMAFGALCEIVVKLSTNKDHEDK
jgi:hypothetical protein